jgi:hypothetical protein
VLCGALLTGVAHAQGVPALVVLVASDPASQAARRLSKELQGIGIDVLVLKATPENSSGRESLERSARSVGAIAAVRLVASGGGTEVWVADRITGKTVIRELMGPKGADAEPDDIAVGAVELLRASLMELHSPNPPRGEAEAPQVVRDLAVIKPSEPLPVSKPHPARFSLAAGPAMDLGLGHFGVSLHSNVAAWAWLTKGAGVRAFASVPLATERFTVPEGAAQVSAGLLGLGVTLDLRPPEKRWIPIVGAGVALAHVITLGQGNLPRTDSSASGWYAGGYGQLGVALRVTPALRVRLDAVGLALATPPAVLVNERSVGHWGRPAGSMSLAVELFWAP